MADGDAPLSPQQVAGGVLPGILDRARVVVTPYPFGVSDADFIRVTVFNAMPGVVVNVHGRQAAPGVDSKPFDFTLSPTSDRQATTQDFVIGGGFVTNVSVFASGATPQIGQTFVIVQLVRSKGATAFIMGTLLAGPITSTQAMGWPGSPIINTLDSLPPVRRILGSAPAAGAEVFEAVPTGARWHLLSFDGQFTTDAVAGVRRVFLQIHDGVTPLLQVLPATTQNATQGFRYLWAPNMPPAFDNLNGFSQQAIPSDVILLAGQQIRTVTLGLDPGDQWIASVYSVHEYLEGR